MDDLPFDMPVLLRSYEQSDLENLFGMDFARCRPGGSQGALGAMVLRRVNGNSVAIQSFRNNRFLEVDPASGDCRFVDVQELADRHLFEVEMHVIPKTPNHLFFVSRASGKLLHCAQWGFVRCDDYERRVQEAWALIDPLVGGAGSSAAVLAASGHDERRRQYILELGKADRSPKDIRELVDLMYPPGK